MAGDEPREEVPTMTAKLTPAGRRALLAADEDTGLLRGGDQTLAGLAKEGLAVRHPRPPHRHYLTAAGRDLRRGILAPQEPDAGPAPPTAPGVFEARTGGGPPPADPGARAREVRSAWEGLLDLRRVTSPGGNVGLPSPWERTHLASAAALALEASGLEPASGETPGYQVVAAEHQPDAVRVDWRGPVDLMRLVRCAGALEGAGWQVSEHPERDGGLYLLASPRRAAPAEPVSGTTRP